MAQYIFSAQTNYGFPLTFEAAGKAPLIAKRIWGTYAEALEFANDVTALGTAVPGLMLSVINDSDVKKNGVYRIVSVATSAGAGDAVLEKVGAGAGSLTAETYTKALAMAEDGTASIGQLIYVTTSESISGKTYNAGAYVVAGVGAAAALQYLTSESAGASGLTGRVTALETEMGSVKTDVTNLKNSAHTHSNKSVLDGITEEKVTAWDEAKDKAIESAATFASAYTDGKLAVYATSADTESAIAKAKGEAVESAATFASAYTDAAIAEALKEYATSADTESAIAKAKGEAVESATTFASAYTDGKLAAYATSADTESAIAKAKGEAIESAATFASAYTDAAIEVLSGSAKVELTTAESATSGYLKTYVIKQGGSEIGKIDIPKDLVVKEGKMVNGTWSGDTFTEDPSGKDKALKLIIANREETPIYINVKDLVDVYTAGNGIEITSANVITAKVVAENGLSLDANGIKLGKASADADGAMSKEDFAKLGGIESGAQVNVLEGVKLNGADIDITDKKADIIVNGANVKVTKDLSGSTIVSGTAVDDVLQGIFDSLNGVKKAAVNEVEAISGLTATITSGETGAKLELKVKTEVATSGTVSNGHIEIKINDNGELYGQMYYLED